MLSDGASSPKPGALPTVWDAQRAALAWIPVEQTRAARNGWAMHDRRSVLGVIRVLAVILALLLAATLARAEEQAHPLKPADRSSPRAALKAFLDESDELARFLAQDYLPAPSREKFSRGARLGNRIIEALDLSEVPPAARMKTGRAAAAALYDVLGRLPPSALQEAPDAAQMEARTGARATRWVIPDTEIALVRAERGPRAGEFLFAPDTVERAEDFYDLGS